jgi:NitT/TauT family transport system substrate-binding protein
MVKALNRGTVETIRDPAAALAVMKAGDPMMKTDLESVRLEIALGHTYTENTRKNGLSAVTPARVQSTIDAVAAAYKIQTAPKVADVWTDKFLPPAAERMVGK